MNNPEIIVKNAPFKHFCMSIGAIPTSYKDTLDYYETLLWLIKYLEETIIPTVNNNGEAVSELQQLYIELKNFVDNYFDNLDVQEEINNKLDDMASDGTLESIFQKLINQDDLINFHTVFATKYYRSSEDNWGMQGGCVLPNGTIIQCTGNHGETTGKILHFAEDGTLLNSATVNYGHCNGVTYNSKTDTIFITSTASDTIGRYKVFEIDTNLQEINEYDCADKDFPGYPYGIVYVEEEDTYIFMNSWRLETNKYMWKTDKDFNIISQKEYDIEVRSTSNIGRFDKYVCVNTISDNCIMLFNLSNLEFFKQATINEVISDTWVLTEVEWFDTRNDKVYLGFIPASATSPRHWGSGTKVYACYDPKFNYNEIRSTNTEFSPSGEVYYVDYTANYNPLRDGSSDAPFENINEALNSALRTNNITGNVDIYIANDSETQDSFFPYFSMNKTYKIRKTDNTPIISMAGLYVSSGSKVIINRGLTLTANSTTYSNRNILNLGHLYIDGTLKMSDSSKVIIGGELDSETICVFSQDGYDLTNFYGTLINNSSSYISQNDNENPYLILRNTTVPTYFNTKVKNLKLELSPVTTNKYQIPNISEKTNVTVRFTIPTGSDSTNFSCESNYVYTAGLYNSYPIPYMDSNDELKYFKIIFSNSGELTLSGITASSISNLRVRVNTL